MKYFKIILIFLICLIYTPSYGIDIDANSDSAVDTQYGGLGYSNWVIGNVPYCSTATSGSAGEFIPIPGLAYDGVTDNRLECTTAVPAYFSAGIDLGSSDTPSWTPDDAQDTGTQDAQIIVNCPTTNNCNISIKVDSGSASLLYEIFKINSAADATTVQIGNPGTNYLNIDESGNTSFVGTSYLLLPNNTTDRAMATAGEIYFNTTDEQISVHSAADGEISGEAAISVIQHGVWIFDPKIVCDGAVDRLFMFTVGPDSPEGITIDKWSLSFEADPTTELDADLKRADAFIGVGSSAVVDALDTLTGTSTEDTDSNINSGAVVATGKVLYIEIITPYTEANHQVIFEMWWHSEED